MGPMGGGGCESLEGEGGGDMIASSGDGGASSAGPAAGSSPSGVLWFACVRVWHWHVDHTLLLGHERPQVSPCSRYLKQTTSSCICYAVKVKHC